MKDKALKIIGIVENCPDGMYGKTRLQFAHAETVIPFLLPY